jgi:hypothetical protein
MVFSTINGSDQTVRTLHRDLPWPPGTKGTFLPHILCEECEEKVGFWPRNRSEVGHFEVHLQSPPHRQFVENRKASSIAVEQPINSGDSEQRQNPKTDPPLEPTIRGWWEDPLPWSLRPPVESLRIYPPDRDYPDKMEEELDELAKSGSLGVLEGEGFGHHIYGKAGLGRVGNDRKRGVSPSSDNPDTRDKERSRKRRRSKRLARRK